jgi:hypothetical protein
MEGQSFILISRMFEIILLGDKPIVCPSLTELMTGHINNLHNTTYWALVNQGMSERDATKRLEVPLIKYVTLI